MAEEEGKGGQIRVAGMMMMIKNGMRDKAS